MARPVCGPSCGREPARRGAALTLPEPASDPDGRDELTRDDPPDEDPPELALEPEPLRGAAVPVRLPDDDDDGVREPAGVCIPGSRDDEGAGALLVVEPPPPPEELDEPDDPAGRGIACASEVAGTASAIATAKTMSERGFLSMSKLLHQRRPDRAAPAAGSATILPPIRPNGTPLKR
jgi:hypothetical protein